MVIVTITSICPFCKTTLASEVMESDYYIEEMATPPKGWVEIPFYREDIKQMDAMHGCPECVKKHEKGEKLNEPFEY